jgi:hypothetical protein
MKAIITNRHGGQEIQLKATKIGEAIRELRNDHFGNVIESITMTGPTTAVCWEGTGEYDLDGDEELVETDRIEFVN